MGKAAMHACRAVNEYSIAVRYLEAVQWKCGPQKKVIWPYLLNEIQPTLDELGILTPNRWGTVSRNCTHRMSTTCTRGRYRLMFISSYYLHQYLTYVKIVVYNSIACFHVFYGKFCRLQSS